MDLPCAKVTLENGQRTAQPTVIAKTYGTRTPRGARKINLQNPERIRIEMGRVYRDMRSGSIETQDGTRLVYVLDRMLRAYEAQVVVDAELRPVKIMIAGPCPCGLAPV